MAHRGKKFDIGWFFDRRDGEFSGANRVESWLIKARILAEKIIRLRRGVTQRSLFHSKSSTMNEVILRTFSFFILCSLGMGVALLKATPQPAPKPQLDLPKATLTLGTNTLKAQIAADDQSRE